MNQSITINYNKTVIKLTCFCGRVIDVTPKPKNPLEIIPEGHGYGFASNSTCSCGRKLELAFTIGFGI